MGHVYVSDCPQFLCGADVRALDSSGLRADYPKQGGTSVGTRAWGLSMGRLCIAVIYLGVTRHTVLLLRSHCVPVFETSISDAIHRRVQSYFGVVPSLTVFAEGE